MEPRPDVCMLLEPLHKVRLMTTRQLVWPGYELGMMKDPHEPDRYA